MLVSVLDAASHERPTQQTLIVTSLDNATIFNSAIGLGCSWNPALVKDMAVVIGKEARAYGVNQIFAPVADLARELRHGRVEEMYGECSYLRKVLPANECSRMVYHLRVAYSHFIPFKHVLGAQLLRHCACF